MRILVAAAFVVLSALGRTDVRIAGRIMDQTGAPIPDAAVRLKLAATTGSQRLVGEAVCPTSLTSATPGTTVLALASRDGTFSFPAESRQAYELNVESPGFATIVKTIHVGAEKEFKAGDIVLSDRKSTRLNSSHLVISYAV